MFSVFGSVHPPTQILKEDTMRRNGVLVAAVILSLIGGILYLLDVAMQSSPRTQQRVLSKRT